MKAAPELLSHRLNYISLRIHNTHTHTHTIRHLQRENREIYGEDRLGLASKGEGKGALNLEKRGVGGKGHKYSVRAKLVKGIEIGRIKYKRSS